MRHGATALATALAGLLAAPVAGVELAGYLAAEQRLFAHPAPDPRQHRHDVSLVVEPEWYAGGGDGRDSLTARVFARLDRGDPRRTHFDLREFAWRHAAETWEVSAGLGRVFWGVTESQHLVDVINQTDAVENPDGEDKLGQPMIDLALVRGWGTIDLFVLPGFRPRTFPGPGGRLRGVLPIDTDAADYGAATARRHVDLALRWSHSIGEFDVGLAHFRGTGREPVLRAAADAAGRPVLRPFYPQIRQTSLDLQATRGAWLLKLEALQRSGQGRTFTALVGGFEYTLAGVFDSVADLGVLAEYSFDDRAGAATTPFQNDLFAGLRLAFNDAASSEALAGVITDLSGGARLFSLEASRRLGERWKLSLEARMVNAPAPAEALRGLRRDDYLQIELARYF